MRKESSVSPLTVLVIICLIYYGRLSGCEVASHHGLKKNLFVFYWKDDGFIEFCCFLSTISMNQP